MGKGYKGKTCVYCAERPATTADHVFAREFFLRDRRSNLPKVPACEFCNPEKSKLEHYLTGVLPFGGRHEDSTTNLTEMVPPRLAKNVALHRRLATGMSYAWAVENGLLVPAMTLPFESEKVDRLFRFIAKGLAWHHWRVLLDGKTGVWAGILSAQGEEIFKALLAQNGRARVSESVGAGTFTYDGLQGTDIPQLSVWTFRIYGGITLGGDPVEPAAKTSIVGAMTATKEALARFQAMGLTPNVA